MFSLICTWTNGWVNNWDASDLRGHRPHHDVIVTLICFRNHSMRKSPENCAILDAVKLQNAAALVIAISYLWLMVNYSDVIMGAMASQITSLTIVYSTVYSGADQRKHQSSASLAFVWGIHRWPVNSPHKRPVTRKIISISWRHHVIVVCI